MKSCVLPNSPPRTVSTVNAFGSSRTSSPGNAAWAIRSRISASATTPAVARALLDEHHELVDRQLLARGAGPARRVRCAADRRSRRGCRSRELDDLVADRDLVAFLCARGLERLGQLLVAGRAARDTEARVRSEDAIAAPPRARAIDEVVREALGLLLRQRLGLGDVPEEPALERVDACAGRRRDAGRPR